MKKTRRFDNRGKLLWEIAFRSRGVAAANPVELPSRKTKDAESKTSIFLPPPRRKSNFAFTLNCRPKKKKRKLTSCQALTLIYLSSSTRRFAIRLSSSLRWDRENFSPFLDGGRGCFHSGSPSKRHFTPS